MKFAGNAKVYTREILPTPSSEWESSKAKQMEEIRLLRAHQSPKYQKALLDTGDDYLVHNMETDSVWGFGIDGKGRNLQGNIDMNVRSILRSEKNEDKLEVGDDRETELEIVTDSLLSDVQSHLLELDIRSNVNSYSGKGANYIANTVGIIAGKKPKYLLLHMGTNSVDKEDFTVVRDSFIKAVNDVKWTSDSTTVILSGLIHRLDRPDLNFKIDYVNDFLQSLESNKVTYMANNKTFKSIHRILDKQGLHLRPAGYGQVARNIQACMLGSHNADQAQLAPGPWRGNQPSKTAQSTNRGQARESNNNRYQPKYQGMMQHHSRGGTQLRSHQIPRSKNRSPSGSTQSVTQHPTRVHLAAPTQTWTPSNKVPNPSFPTQNVKQAAQRDLQNPQIEPNPQCMTQNSHSGSYIPQGTQSLQNSVQNWQNTHQVAQNVSQNHQSLSAFQQSVPHDGQSVPHDGQGGHYHSQQDVQNQQNMPHNLQRVVHTQRSMPQYQDNTVNVPWAQMPLPSSPTTTYWGAEQINQGCSPRVDLDQDIFSSPSHHEQPQHHPQHNASYSLWETAARTEHESYPPHWQPPAHRSNTSRLWGMW